MSNNFVDQVERELHRSVQDTPDHQLTEYQREARDKDRRWVALMRESHRGTTSMKSNNFEHGGNHSARQAFSLAVASAMQAHPHWTRQQAIKFVARTQPELHEAYKESMSPIRPQTRRRG